VSVPASVAIVGGGIAGFSAAGELRRRGYDGGIRLIDPGPVPYDRPPLSKGYLSGEQSREQLRLARAGWYEANAVDLRPGRAAVGIEPSRAAVLLDDGTEERVAAVLVATGGRPRRLQAPGARSERVHVLRTIADADRLRAALVPGAALTIVGAGLIGAEVASTARALGAEVALIDPAPVPLEGAVGPELARHLHAMHALAGIRTLLGGVTAIEEPIAGGPVVVCTTNGDRIESDAVLVGIGIVPETTLVHAAGLAVDDGILVDERFRTSVPGVWAAGDAARRRLADGTVLRRAEHWDGAAHGGRAAAASILGEDPEEEGAAWFWTDRHAVHVECVGEMNAPGATVVRGTLGAGPAALFRVAAGLLVGAAAIDDPMAIRAARRLIERRVPLDLDALGDPSVDLRRLARP
jgi:NADPH-dependent 2,4-dienoyl-CoA reductase/sulfur reductase-like enzyme